MATTRINSCCCPQNARLCLDTTTKVVLLVFWQFWALDFRAPLHRFVILNFFAQKSYSFEWSLPMFLHTAYPRHPATRTGEGQVFQICWQEMKLSQTAFVCLTYRTQANIICTTCMHTFTIVISCPRATLPPLSLSKQKMILNQIVEGLHFSNLVMVSRGGIWFWLGAFIGHSSLGRPSCNWIISIQGKM